MSNSHGEPDFDQARGANEILSALRRRRQILQLQEAKGINEPKVIIDIEELTLRISAQQEEVHRLETEAVVDRWTFTEAQYRELLAGTWGTERGVPTVLGLERLERVRIESAIARERAQELERDIRTLLAKETLDNLDYWYLTNQFQHDIRQMTQYANPIDEKRDAMPLVQLRQIGKALRLDTPLTQEHFFKLFPNAKATMYYFDQASFGFLLFRANNVFWGSEVDLANFEAFYNALPTGSASK